MNKKDWENYKKWYEAAKKKIAFFQKPENYCCEECDAENKDLKLLRVWTEGFLSGCEYTYKYVKVKKTANKMKKD